MKPTRNVSTWRSTALVALMSLVWSTTGCDRQTDPDAESVSEPFTLPHPDVSKLPDGLQFRVQSLQSGAEQSPKNPDPVGKLGAIYYVHGFPEAAASCFLRARQLDPESVKWWYYSALVLSHTGKNAEATAAYERALELDANYQPLYVRLARLLVESDPKRAADLCRRALELDATDPTAVFALGLCEERQGNPAAALTQFENALEKSPNYGEAHESAARVLTALNRAKEAQAHQAAVATGKTPLHDDPHFENLLRTGFSGEILIRDTLLLAQRGLFEQADLALAMLADADGTGLATHQTTGIVRAMQGRLEEAAERFRLVLEARPEAWAVRAELAGVLARMNQPAEAEAELRMILEKQPDARFALEPLCRLLLNLERAAEAEQLLAAALERQPDAIWIRMLLGDALLVQDKDADARQQYQACLDKIPAHTGARYSLGVLAQRAGDLEAAKREWERVLEIAPSFVDAHSALANLALQERDFATAERHLRAGLQRVPDFPGLINTLAWILATAPDDEQRKGDEAVQLAQRACELTQNRQHAYLDTLAAAYAEARRFDDAIRTAHEAIRLAEEAQDDGAVAGYRQRLALYEKKQPYRDEE